MNKRHDAQIGNWLRRHGGVVLLGAAVIVVFVGGLTRLASHAPKAPFVVPASRADSPSSYVEACVKGDSPTSADPLRVCPAKAETVPLPPMRARTLATTVSPVAAPLPTVEYCATQVPALVPPVEAGPELFGPIAKPAAVSDSPPSRGTSPAAKPAPAAVQPLPAVAKMGTPPAPQSARSESMEMIARQADEKVREGMELADRGASFSARANFIAALRLLAQGLDNDAGTTCHSQSLSAALTAMKEAQDFIPAPGKVEGELDLPPIVAGHRTPLLKKTSPEQLQAMRALKQYFNFAQEQLCQAVGHEVSGSMALGALGKLHAALANKPSVEVALPEAKAITFFQAALLVYPRNYMAANDLGVLLAHKNDYASARKALEHSVMVCRCAENLRNLSVVYRQLDEARLADLAARDAEAFRTAEVARQRSGSRSAGGAVQWVDASAFAKPSGQWNDMPVRPAATAAAPQGSTAANPAATGPSSAPPAAPMLR